jgi:broad specificity phosphatase PhoE
MKIITIRHGETEWNAIGREMGQLDSPLTPQGIKQAEAIAKRLSSSTFSALYTSDLGRAHETAKFIESQCDVSLVLNEGLRERNMGIFQGLTRKEMHEKFPKERAEYESVGYEYVIPNGESAKQRCERSVKVMTEIAMNHPNEDDVVVTVTHGGFLMGFFEQVLGILPSNGWRFKRYNASYSMFEYRNNKWALVTWNDVIHLNGMNTLHDPSVQS